MKNKSNHSFLKLIKKLPDDFAFSGATSRKIVRRRAVYRDPTAIALLRMSEHDRNIYKQALDAAEAPEFVLFLDE